MVPQCAILKGRQKSVVVHNAAFFVAASLLRQLNDVLALFGHVE